MFSEHLDYLFQQELCRQAKIEYAEETRKAQELHDKIKADVAEAKYNKHYDICWEVSTLYQASQLVQTIQPIPSNAPLTNGRNFTFEFWDLPIFPADFH